MAEEYIGQEIAEQPINPLVDYVEYGKDWAKGYKDGEVVITFGNDGKTIDPTAIHLYDVNRKEVIPTPAPLDEITKLQLAFAELLEGVLG